MLSNCHREIFAFGEEGLQKAAAAARRGTKEPCLGAAHRAPCPRNPVSEPRMGPLDPSSPFDWHGLALWAEQVDALPFCESDWSVATCLPISIERELG